MSFYCIVENKHSTDTSLKYLKKSCEEKNIKFIPIEVENFNFTNKINLTKNDLFYRVKTGSKARIIESFLLNEEVSSFYTNPDYSFINKDLQDIIYYKNNLPIPKTINYLPKNKELLKKYVEHLGGFPIVIKALGGSHGVGVMRIDSMESLISIIDFFNSKKFEYIKTDFKLSEFIDHNEQARINVLGDKVIASTCNIKHSSEFRLNINIKKEIKEYPKEINQIAIKAVHSLGIEFGGVDIMIDKNNKPYVSEVNFPCNFSKAQEFTGIDISGMMIDYLIKKSKK
ncbi:MAG: hypothetical protein KAT32_01765 [Candidatus Moranbacteria bacterium]|nr:hypothetical protein [Candidatus Moranbacteria bacterium]